MAPNESCAKREALSVNSIRTFCEELATLTCSASESIELSWPSPPGPVITLPCTSPCKATATSCSSESPSTMLLPPPPPDADTPAPLAPPTLYCVPKF